MKLSIVTTLYKSQDYIQEFYERASKAASKITKDFEFIFVNDGSPDDSVFRAIQLHEKQDNVSVVNMSKNFGHHKALMTGLMHAKGDYVFLIDIDLEEPPEILNSFWEELQKDQDVDVIYGVAKERNGSIFRKISGHMYFWVFNFFSDDPIPHNFLTVRLMRQKYVKALSQHKETNIVFSGLCSVSGFNQQKYVVDKKYKGSSAYTLRKKINLMVESVTSFSEKPLTYISYLGLLLSFISFFVICVFIGRVLLFGNPPSGWASTIVSLWFFSGLIIFCIGVIGIYIAKIYKEVKNRPYTVIKDLYLHSSKKK